MDWKINCFILILLMYIGHCQENVQEQADLDGVSTTDAVITPKQKTLGDTINDFGYKLMLTMMEQTINENVVISPTSIAGLLAMTLLGTVGKTYEELATALGFSQDVLENRIKHEQFGDLLHTLNANDTASRTVFADAIYVDEQVTLRELFRSYMKRVYSGDVFNVDFKHKEQVKDNINEWVKIHTMGKIDNFLQKALPMDTKLVLLSALYFSGQWEHPFLPQYTKGMNFSKESQEIMVPLMLNMGHFNYVQSKDYDMHMVALPYNDSITTMYVLKPRVPKRQSLLELMRKLDNEKIDQLISQMGQDQCIIRFPKMDLQSNINVETSLKALGVHSLFSPTAANFALMVDDDKTDNTTEVKIEKRINDPKIVELLNGLSNPGIYVDSVLHNVKLTVNEFGTEAAAVTSSILARTARLFFCNTPFYMFIRNERTKLITFSAAIFDPTK